MSAENERPSDQEILAYQKKIQAEFLAQPPVGEARGFDALVAEYAENEAVARKTRQLQTAAQKMR